jgi:nitrate reductase gamma subunit
MNRYNFSLNAYDLVFVATIVVGLAFGALLMFTRRLNKSANRFLGKDHFFDTLIVCAGVVPTLAC